MLEVCSYSFSRDMCLSSIAISENCHVIKNAISSATSLACGMAEMLHFWVILQQYLASFPVSTPQLFFAHVRKKSWGVETGNEASNVYCKQSISLVYHCRGNYTSLKSVHSKCGKCWVVANPGNDLVVVSIDLFPCNTVYCTRAGSIFTHPSDS